MGSGGGNVGIALLMDAALAKAESQVFNQPGRCPVRSSSLRGRPFSSSLCFARTSHLSTILDTLRCRIAPTLSLHNRAVDNLRQRLGNGLWVQSLAQVTDADRELVSHLLTGTLSA